MQFSVSGWILPKYNANTLILIRKHQNADCVEQYRPIAMANFKFKVISKIIAVRLASILPTIVSSNKKGFINGRNIKDCLCLASEAINIIDKKAFGVNMALKIDITKAFDTLELIFFFKVLGFLDSTTLFVIGWLPFYHLPLFLLLLMALSRDTSSVQEVSGKVTLCHLSFFCLEEEVLSRGINRLVDEGNIKLITGARKTQITSHCLYEDDIVIYCGGNFDSLAAFH